MTKRFKFILLFVSTLVFAFAGLIAACAPGNDPDSITYTVTVTCTDATAEELADVMVQLFESSTAATEPTPLTDGKASFLLAPATYTVKLTGSLLETYAYPETVLTADSPSVTVELTRSSPAVELDYSVTVTSEDAAALSEIKVQLYDGETRMGEQALVGGTAKFTLPAGTYRVVLTGVPTAYTYTMSEVTAQDPTVVIRLVLKNIEYSVTVTCDNANVFADLKAEIYASDERLAAGPLSLASGTVVFELAPGDYSVTLTGAALTSYTYPDTTLTAQSPTAVIALTARPATGDGSEDSPFILTELAGNYEETPVKVTTDIMGMQVTDYMPVYYTYTETESRMYILSTDTDYLGFYLEEEGGSGYLIEWYGSYAGQSETFSLDAGKTYLIVARISTENSETFDDGDTLRFTIAESAGDGSEDAPYILSEIAGSFTADTSNGPVCYRYTASKTASYTVTSEDDFLSFYIEDVVSFMSADETSKVFRLAGGKTYDIVVSDAEDRGRAVGFTITEGGEVTQISYSVTFTGLDASRLSDLQVTLIAEDGTVSETKSPIIGGKVVFVMAPGTYTVSVSGELMNEYTFEQPVTLTADSPNTTVTLVPKADAGTPDDRWEGGGTASNPYLLEDLAGDISLTAPQSQNSVFFKYTADEDATYILSTTVDNLYIVIGIDPWVDGSTRVMWQYGSQLVKRVEFKVFKGCVYTVEVKDSEKAGKDIQFKFEKKDLTQKAFAVTLANAIPSYMGTVELPDTLFAQGETATVTITPKTGYRVAAVTVSGQLVELKGTALEIDMQDNTSVGIYFTAEALKVADGSGTYYPALVGTWRHATYGELVIKTDGTVTLNGQTATLTPQVSEEFHAQHEFSFSVTAGEKTYDLIYNLQYEMYEQGSGANVRFEPVIDLTGYLGTWTSGDMSLKITEKQISFSTGGDFETSEKVAVCNAETGATELYVYLLPDGASKYVAFLVTINGDTLTLTAGSTTYTFTKE